MGFGRVLENGPGEHKKGDPGEYRKSGIRASTKKVGSVQVPKRWDPGEYRKGGSG